MKLVIDTSQVRIATVSLGKAKKTGSSPLPLIHDLLKEQKLTLSDITEIQVSTGPGSYTGLRVGTAVANALGYTLGVPVNGKKALAIPTYS